MSDNDVMTQIREATLGEFPGTSTCSCGERPETGVGFVSGIRHYQCCDSGWKDIFEWNLYVEQQKTDDTGVDDIEKVADEFDPTPEEEEAFRDLERRLNPEPEPGVFRLGKKIERLGKLLQDPNTDMRSLCDAARDAGLNLQFRVQPKVEEPTIG